MKNIVFILIILALISKINYAHGNEPELFNTEITVFNFTSDTLEVLLHPVSALFNGNNYYSLIAKTMIISQNNNSYNYNLNENLIFFINRYVHTFIKINELRLKKICNGA